MAIPRVLEQITPFVELVDKKYCYNDIKLDIKFIKGALLGLMENLRL